MAKSKGKRAKRGKNKAAAKKAAPVRKGAKVVNEFTPEEGFPEVAPEPQNISDPRANLQRVKVADLTPHPVLKDLVPAPASSQRKALRDAIRGEGIQYPVIVAKREDGALHIIDGMTRASLAPEVGISWLVADIREGMTEDEIIALGVELNAGRRQMTSSQRRVLAVDLLTRFAAKGWTDREVARRTSVSPTTVGKVRQELVNAGKIPGVPTEQRTDKLGRKASGPRNSGKAKPRAKASKKGAAKNDGKALPDSLTFGKAVEYFAEHVAPEWSHKKATTTAKGLNAGQVKALEAWRDMIGAVVAAVPAPDA